jgi:hypothetical protein
MAISFVAEGQYTFTGTANDDVFARIPTGTQAGDLMVCSFGNVSNQTVGCTMNNSWTKIEEDTSGTNCYFLMAAKIATSTDASNAGTDTQIATLDSTLGQTVKTCQSASYRGTKNTVGTAVIASNFTHESSPADQTISTNSASSTVNNQWYVVFFNMADTGDATGSSWSSNAASSLRGDAEVSDGSTTSSNAIFDSNGTIAVQSWSRTGTWSGSATRLNAGIMILDPAQVAETADAEHVAVTGTANKPNGGVGAKAQVIG